MQFEFEGNIFPYVSIDDQQQEKNQSSRIEVSANIFNKIPFGQLPELILFRIFKIDSATECKFYVSFGGIDMTCNPNSKDETVKMPRWCMKHMNIKPFERVKFQYVENIEPVNFLVLLPISINFKREISDEEERFAFLQTKMRNYLVIQTGTQIELYNSTTKRKYQFIIGDMYDSQGNQILVGKTLNCDITIDIQYPIDKEEEERIAREKKEREEKLERERQAEEEKRALDNAYRAYKAFKEGRLMGYSQIPKDPFRKDPVKTVIVDGIIVEKD